MKDVCEKISIEFSIIIIFFALRNVVLYRKHKQNKELRIREQEIEKCPFKMITNEQILFKKKKTSRVFFSV